MHIRGGSNRVGLALGPAFPVYSQLRHAAGLQMRDAHIDGVVVARHGLFFAARKEVADLALAHHLPRTVYSRETVGAGAPGLAMVHFGGIVGSDRVERRLRRMPQGTG